LSAAKVVASRLPLSDPPGPPKRADQDSDRSRCARSSRLAASASGGVRVDDLHDRLPEVGEVAGVDQRGLLDQGRLASPSTAGSATSASTAACTRASVRTITRACS
jgi:hypothetical protein